MLSSSNVMTFIASCFPILQHWVDTSASDAHYLFLILISIYLKFFTNFFLLKRDQYTCTFISECTALVIRILDISNQELHICDVPSILEFMDIILFYSKLSVHCVFYKDQSTSSSNLYHNYLFN